MNLTPLYDPRLGPMPVIGFMSGSGSNIKKLLEHQKKLNGQAYHFVALVTDCPEKESNALQIGKEWNLPVVENIKREFFKEYGIKRFTPDLRETYDKRTLDKLAAQGIKAPVAAFGGYMTLASPYLINAMTCVNVHPADLTIQGDDGKRKYRGDNAVVDAINAGELSIKATTHIADEEADRGPILMVSQPLRVVSGVSADEHQSLLKKVGDWKIFPRTLELIANGWYQRDPKGNLYFLEEAIPQGIRFDTLRADDYGV